jgi:uncharacterized membrane protein
MNITIYLVTLVTLAVFDGIWLSLMVSSYKGWLGHLFASTVSFTPVVIFYLIYTLGVSLFVVSPGLKQGSSLVWIFVMGALFGLVAYATYDLTNQATLKDWPLIVTLVDLAWGSFFTGAASVVVVSIINYFK